MKQLIIAVFAIMAVISCSNEKKEDHTSHNSPTSSSAVEGQKEADKIKPLFTKLDGSVSVHIKEVFDHYIHIKTALVSSNSSEAKNGANALLQVLKSFDRSMLPAEQKPTYDKSIGTLKTYANNIAAASEIENQREYFAELSTEAYKLAKSFGAGKTLYHDHCPMALNDKGAMWLSENKEIQNPYFGDKMLNCGSVEEIIEQ